MKTRSRASSVARIGTAPLVMMLAAQLLLAQERTNPEAPYSDTPRPDAPYSDRTRAIDENESRAEKAAEQMVSLPAEKIIALLEQEPEIGRASCRERVEIWVGVGALKEKSR